MSDYETLRLKQVARFGELMPEYIQHLSWPRERIEHQQTAGLRRIVGVAQEKSAWHRARLGHVDVATLMRADLQSLPVMTKGDLMSNWDQIVTDPRLTLDRVNRHLETITTDTYLFDEYHAVASGGSSGVRGVFVWGFDAWAMGGAAGIRWGARRAMANPQSAVQSPVMATVGASAPTHMSSAGAKTFAPPFPSHRFPVTMPMREIVAGLNAVQPTQLMGYASALYELAREALRGTLRITPATVAPDGEPLLPEMRKAMEQAWGAPVGCFYGTSEGMFTGVSCFQGAGMHLSEDLLIIEPVDAQGRPMEAGETSAKIYMTNLFNTALPLIRYEITDQLRVLQERCPCGSEFQRVDDIEGRLDHVFSYAGDVVIHPHVFRSPLSREPEIIEYQVRQTPRGAAVAVRTSGDIDLEALRTTIAAHVSEAGLDGAEITIREVSAIERTSAGKLTRFVPLSP
jgi:phenylacetate-CoA ligase